MICATLSAESVADVDETAAHAVQLAATARIAGMSHLEARRAPGCTKSSMYGRDWETCVGTDGMILDELDELMATWKREDRREGSPNEYRVVRGTALTDDEMAQWLQAETMAGRQLTILEFLTFGA